MKIKHIKWYIIITLVISLNSCLKDKEYNSGAFQATGGSTIRVISIGLNVVDNSNISILAYDNSSTDTTVNLIPVELGGPNVAQEDIHITLEKEDALVDSMNAQLNAQDEAGDFVVPPGVTPVNPDLIVTIPKGSRVGYLQVKFVPADLLGGDYAMGYKIKSVQESGYAISGNLATGIAILLIKNQYDGVYQYTTSANTSLVPNKNAKVELHTLSATTVKIIPGLLATYSNEVDYTIDPVTNQITVTCPSLGVQTPQDPRSKYDPATKTLHVYWKQGNGGRTFEETFVYLGPR